MLPAQLPWPQRAGEPGVGAIGSADRPVPGRGVDRVAGFLFKLEPPEGAPAEPPSLSAAVPNWGPGDVIHLGTRALRVVGVRDEDADQPPVLVVEDMAG
jgi:hypothetical protein